jgi:hypothetical protein
MIKFKYNYIGHVCDVKKENINFSKFSTKDIPYSTQDSTVKTYQKGNETIVKTFTNHKLMFFCRCGKSFDIKTPMQTHIYSYSIENLQCPKLCKSCGNSINKKDTIKLNREFFSNKTKRNYCCFEDEDRIQLVKFDEFTGVNLSSKKIFRKEYRSSIVFNKKSKRFYLYDSRNKFVSKVIGVGIFNLNQTLHTFLEGISLGSKVCYNEDNKILMTRDIKKSLLDPLNKFYYSLLELIDKRDVKRVSEYLNDIKAASLKSDKSNNNNTAKEEYVKSLFILFSIIQYPYLSNILFNNGVDVYLSTLEKSPSVSYFKKDKPTSPIKILKEMAIGWLRFNKSLICKSELKFYTNKKLRELKLLKESEIDKLENNRIIKDLLLRVNFIENRIKNYKKISLPNTIYKKISLLKMPTLDFVLLYMSLIETASFTKEEMIYLIEKSDINILCESIINFSSENYTHPHLLHFDKSLNKKVKHFLSLKLDSTLEGPSTFFYQDTIRMLEMRNQPLDNLFKIKKWTDIVNLHDELYTLINLEKIEKFNKGIKKFSEKYNIIKTSEINNITFNLIDDVVSLEKESKIMNHCVKSYAQSLSEGKHLLFSIFDKTTGDRATLDFSNLKSNSFSVFHDIAKDNGLKISDHWNFSQLKAKYNKKTTQKIVDAVKSFGEEILKKNNISYTMDFTNYDLVLKSNKINYAGLNINNNIDEEIDNMIDNVDFVNLDDDLPF